MTINPSAWILLAMYVSVAEDRGYDLNKLSGTIQNDILKAYVAQKEWIFPPRPHMRIIRDMLVQQQREIGQQRGNIVTEGRDQGTVVFPNAELKIYLDANPQERARRRVTQLRARGEIVDPAEILDSIIARDQRDASRSTGPLAVASDAVVIDTTNLSEPEVVDRIVTLAQS